MGELQWLHSGGTFNKEPDNDLGNYPSRFEISGEPNPQQPTATPNVMNNLFRDVMPEESLIGMTDYRCFYIWNPKIREAIRDIILNLSQCEDCGSNVLYGSKFRNDVQTITISCEGFETTPDDGGYVVFDCEFGAPFTVYYTTAGGFAQFGADLQTQLRKLPWCETVTVVGANPYTVTFNGGAGNRNVQLIRVVQNDLLIKGIARLDTVTYYAYEDWNGYNDAQVKTVEKISNYIPQTGNLRIYNPLTGIWDSYPYESHTDFIFNIVPATPLQFNMVGFLGTAPPYADVNDPSNWHRSAESPETDTSLPVPWGVVEAPLLDKTCEVCIGKSLSGGPINTIAKPILNPYETPEATFTTASLPLSDKLNLRPDEGFYIWIQRVTPPAATPCLRSWFIVNLDASAITWPFVLGGT